MLAGCYAAADARLLLLLLLLVLLLLAVPIVLVALVRWESESDWTQSPTLRSTSVRARGYAGATLHKGEKGEQAHLPAPMHPHTPPDVHVGSIHDRASCVTI